MAIHSADLNQDALSKLEAEQKFPQVQEQRIKLAELAKDTIKGQISQALKMMKSGKTPVKIDVSILPHYASNGQVTKEQLELSQISAETFQDISKLSPKAQEEFIAIYKEFQKNNPSVSLGKDNPYWQNIFEAVKIKNEIIGDLGELEEGKQAIEIAVIQAGINHGLRGAEAKVERYFKSKIAFLGKIDDTFKQEVLNGEKEFIDSGRDGSQFYGTLLKFTGNKKILGLRVRTIKNKAPNFYIKLSQEVLKDTEHKVFTKDLYDIMKNEEDIKKLEEDIKKGKEKLKKVKEEIRKGKEEIVKYDKINAVLEKINHNLEDINGMLNK